MDALSGRNRGSFGILLLCALSACDASSDAKGGEAAPSESLVTSNASSPSAQLPTPSNPSSPGVTSPDPAAGGAPPRDADEHVPGASGTTDQFEPTRDAGAGSLPPGTAVAEPNEPAESASGSAADATVPSDAVPSDSTAASDSSGPSDSNLPAGSAPTSDAAPSGDAAPRLSEYQPLGEPITLDGLDAASSDVTWRPESDSFFVITDGSRHLYEFDRDFTSLVRTVTLSDGPTDGEGIAYLGNDLFAIASEDNTVVVFHLDPTTTTLVVSDELHGRYVPAPPPSRVNTGFEGITFRPGAGGGGDLVVCQEGDPGNVPIAVYRFLFTPDGPSEASYADGTLDVVQPFDAPATLAGLDGDLTGLAYEGRDDTLLITSHLASRLLKVDAESGALLEQLALSASPQYEGVALASENRLVLVSEPGFVELWQAP